MDRRFLMTKLTGFIAVLCALVLSVPVQATDQQPTEITVGYFQNWPTPGQFAQLKTTFDYALGLKVKWVAYKNGNEMNAAMASGEAQIAYSQGLVPFIIGVTRGLDLNMIGIAVSYAENDNCLVRSDAGITLSTATQLEGQKIAVRVGSLSHYKLLKLLAHIGVDQSRVEIVAITDGVAAATALERGDVVMACASGGALRSMAGLGKPLMSGAELEALGVKLFDIITVPTAFMNEYPDIVQAFMDVVEASNKQWHKNPDPMRAAIARSAGMDLEVSNRTLDNFSFPLAEQQKSATWMGGQISTYSKQLADFFVAQGQLDKSLESYAPYITTRFLR